MIKRVDRYIGLATLLGILAVWVGLTLLMLMFSLLDELRAAFPHLRRVSCYASPQALAVRSVAEMALLREKGEIRLADGTVLRWTAGQNSALDTQVIANGRGDLLVAGAREEDSAANDAGAAYVFGRSANVWTEEQKLIASDAWPQDRFGYAVSISGDTIVVGAFGDDDLGSASGAVYLFYRDQDGADAWGQVAKLTADDGGGEDDDDSTAVKVEPPEEGSVKAQAWSPRANSLSPAPSRTATASGQRSHASSRLLAIWARAISA